MTKQKEIAISVENLHKSFKLPHEGHSGIKQALINLFSKNRKKGYEVQKVLRGLDFEIEKGEFFGIVGRNGSGKSTLLKALAGIYSPDKGAVEINGTLVPFIELGVGFNPELTGRENVFLNGALLGFSHNEMEAMYDDIVEFAELERFMDQKLKNYSSGMQVRLAFSIAIRADGDVLLLDEVLAVGDEAFQRKCFSYFAQLKKKKKTVILVTHDMSSVQRFCTRAALVNKGKIEYIGNTAVVAQKYQDLNRSKTEEVKKDYPQPIANRGTIKAKLVNQSGHEQYNLTGNDQLNFIATIKTDIDIKDAFYGFTIRKEDGELIYWYTTEKKDSIIEIFDSSTPTTLSLMIDNIFGDGSYYVNMSLKSNDRVKEYIIADEIIKFTISGRGVNGWTLHPATKLRVE